MYQFWKKALWAALLTTAFALGGTGCGSQGNDKTDTSAAVASTAAQADSTPAADANASTASEGAFDYEMNDDGTIAITGYSGTETALEIPATIDGYVVSAISNHAFEANWNLVSVTMPNGLTSVGEGAFMDCGSLESVTIPETVSEIQRAAFASCSALTSITLPESVSAVMEEAFTGCSSLSSLTVANASLEYDRWGLIEGAEPLNTTIICSPDSVIAAWAADNSFATQALS